MNDVGARKRRGVTGVLHLATDDHAIGAVEQDGQQCQHGGEGDGHDHEDLAARLIGSACVGHQWFTSIVELLVTSKAEKPMREAAAMWTVVCTVTVTGVPRSFVAGFPSASGASVSPTQPAP